MERTIKFRGKRIDNNKWVYGYYWHNIQDEQHLIIQSIKIDIMVSGQMQENARVDPETVGQFTGLRDKNGVDIFDGDILRTYSIDEGELTEKVIFDSGCFKLSCDSKLDWPIMDYKCDYMLVIGSVHDTPELITN